MKQKKGWVFAVYGMNGTKDLASVCLASVIVCEVEDLFVKGCFFQCQ
jgi:hypothetical protein